MLLDFMEYLLARYDGQELRIRRQLFKNVKGFDKIIMRLQEKVDDKMIYWKTLNLLRTYFREEENDPFEIGGPNKMLLFENNKDVRIR